MGTVDKCPVRLLPAAPRHCAALLEPLKQAIEIGVASAKPPCEPVPAALGNSLAVRDHIGLTGLTWRTDETASMSRRSLRRVTRLATLALLFSQVGQ